ncbi:hypothetical protein [Streptomyces clavuligerus]|uniref:hypothetical protein n=1 Tax=Streptomyces clavuligerus TaxID=1901 RepID=UPI00020D920F|nr:hypothetical protein [Streptomyces clavuligerus]WDN55910.1 hypothetical protein LL058_28855 [Streptomyces clavuligerus]
MNRILSQPTVATAVIDLLGHDWEFAQDDPEPATASIRHRDGKHPGVLLTEGLHGRLIIWSGPSEPPAVLQLTGPDQDADHIAAAVEDVLHRSLKAVPSALNNQLPFETLLAIRDRASNLLTEHNEQVLPRHVERTVQAALDEQTLAEHGAPVSAVLDTTEQDDGYVWLADETRVVLADGTHTTICLGWEGRCRTFLVDHALDHEVSDDDVLTVTFDPPGLRID